MRALRAQYVALFLHQLALSTSDRRRLRYKRWIKDRNKRDWTTRLIASMVSLGKQGTAVRPGQSIHENTHLLGWWLGQFYSVCCSTNHTRNMCWDHIQAMVMGSHYLLSEPTDCSFPGNRRILRPRRQPAPRHRMLGRETGHTRRLYLTPPRTTTRRFPDPDYQLVRMYMDSAQSQDLIHGAMSVHQGSLRLFLSREKHR
ncbi:hypothetical protein QBC32DRAFT_126864 [Pseudoneurospora amorphoporcata]|uniref:Uncharacterized protein n=1 Tax=Pseudoneurospora amorphoporcata TaxID=241081 RepID=A0AAN6NW66_9PEZI|nr:hypothetical protein QBC32DRAFT_126864 [Pseudoneurospora amorphoporcata]